MEIGVLGPLRVVDGGREIAVRRQKHRALLAFFALHAGEVVSVDRLLDELWGARPPPTAKNSLQNHVSQLRKLLGSDVLRTTPPGYVLDLEPEAVDAERFARLIEDARGEAAAERAELLRLALALWRGQPLADVEFEPFALTEAPRLEELHADGQEELVATELELGRHRELVTRIEELVAQQPLRERLRAQLMLALYRSGRQADALAAYRDARRVLVEELGIEPGPALRALEAAILRQDPQLDAPVAPQTQPDLRERRANVTVLVAEVVVPPELDAERHYVLTKRAFHELRAATEYHGGRVERLAGDELVAVFGVPARHEDDALRAVRAALQIRRALDASAEVEVRIALDTGEVVAPGATLRAPVTGAPVTLARRLAEAAPAGLVVAGASTHALVRDVVHAEPLPPLAVRGPVPRADVFRIESVQDQLGRRPLAGTPLVGRAEELAALHAAFEETVAHKRSSVFALLGEAGVGKTRLARELATSLGDEARVVIGRCVAYGEGATWLPLREIVRQASPNLATLFAGEDDGGRAVRTLASVIGLEDAEVSVHDTFWAARRFLQALSRERPLVVVLDDLHWAEPTFLDFVEHLAASPADAPVLVLTLARPELADERPALASLTLAPLADGEVQELVDAAATTSIHADARRRIATLAEGNPLFAEQLLAYAEEHGVDALASVPPTVEALLASRLDRLDGDERGVLQRAAVVGREFWQTAVLELTPELEVPAVGRHLAELERRGLIRRVRSSSDRQDAFRFHQVLIRDVAYGAIPKAERAALHERTAEWLDAQGGADDELVGFHLEQAYKHRVEIGSADRHARSLAADAGDRLAAAGIRAWKRSDAPAASNLLGRATALLPESDPTRAELLCELGIAQRTAGDITTAQRTLEEAVETAPDRRVELRARVELTGMRLFADPEGRAEELLDLASTAIPVFEELGDDRALGRTWLLVGYVHGGLHCRNSAWTDAAERALDHYRRAGWPITACVGEVAASLFHGPTPAETAIRRCKELLESKDGDRAAHAYVAAHLAGLTAMTGGVDEARALLADAKHTFEELGLPVVLANHWGPIAGAVELLAGEPDEAERLLAWSCDLLEKTGENAPLVGRASELADVLYALGRYDEAMRWTDVAEARAASDDIAGQFCWRSVRAKLLARRGEPRKAETLAREAVRLARSTDALNQHAGVVLDLAEVLRIEGRIDEASAAAKKAERLFTRKGNVVAARTAGERVAELSPA